MTEEQKDQIALQKCKFMFFTHVIALNDGNYTSIYNQYLFLYIVLSHEDSQWTLRNVQDIGKVFKI